MRRKLFINSALLIIERFVVLFFSFASALLMARYAGTELFGRFSTIVAFGSLFLVFTQMGLNNISSKYFTLYPHNSAFYLNASLLVRFIFAVLIIPIAYVLGWLTLTPTDAYLVALLVALQVGNAATVIEFFFIAKQSITATLVPRVVIKVACKIALLVAIILELPIALWIILTGLEYILLALAYLLLLKRQPPAKQERLNTAPRLQRGARLLLQRGKWLLLSSLAAVLYLKIDQIMLASFVDTQAVAHYAAAAKLSEFWYVLPVLVANVFMPKLVSLYRAQPKLYWQLQRRSYLYSSIAAIIVIALTLWLAEPVVLLLFGEAYRSSILILQIHIFGCLFIFSRAFMSRWLILSNNHKLSLHSHLVGAIVNIVLNAVLIPQYGGVGAAISSVVAYGMASIGFMVFYRSTRTYLATLVKVS
ncbi:flippase [Pseudoalteromonas sp. McH1-7]|uniref:flippase n=1 Tax=Pseudoalteromonas TaxID=53246 RepID=UPI001592761F|nr:flippase [Pseudoalteromonas peptidolytica]MDW7549413.1 flippase [Pseudoalteromonas peptidolytica]NUZ10686.1 flippase [Pseudoalteromonas sp. McH1-7]